MAEKGISVRLRDLDQKQLDAAEREHRATVKKKLQLDSIAVEGILQRAASVIVMHDKFKMA